MKTCDSTKGKFSPLENGRPGEEQGMQFPPSLLGSHGSPSPEIAISSPPFLPPWTARARPEGACRFPARRAGRRSSLTMAPLKVPGGPPPLDLCETHRLDFILTLFISAFKCILCNKNWFFMLDLLV